MLSSCSTAISADDYERSCDVDEECVGVPQGEKCIIERCGCPGEAINVVDAERFQADLDALVCPDPLNGFGDVCLCAASFPACINNRCEQVSGLPPREEAAPE